VRRTRWRATTAVAALSLTVAGAAGPAPSVPAVAATDGPWASLWMSGGTVGSTGTTLADVRRLIGAASGTAARLTGAGVGVALIDTGVAPVPGLPAAQIVNGPDLSFESQAANLRYLDTYGHGTHLAGIIVGNDTASGTRGIAPKAKLTSIKLGTANGAVDVTQVIAALDWVIAHRADDPANPIKVINLSYGSGGTAPTWSDPLAYAVERAWSAGIVVVVAGGNGTNTPDTLTNPASDQFMLAVGSVGAQGTVGNPDDDRLSPFTETSWIRNVDILAPGESIVSLANRGSNIYQAYPGARVGGTLFRGSGTSQATAVVSAAVALLLQARPTLTPDQVKHLVMHNSDALKVGLGAEMRLRQLDVAAALAAPAPVITQYYARSSGVATLDSSRGPSRVVRDNISLNGENSVWGALNTSTWVRRCAAGTVWQGGRWMGYRLAGDGWTGKSWASRTWAPAAWTGGPWGSATWSDPTWTGRFWSNGSWSGGRWTGRFWSSDDWSSSTWG
jgi:serine protease AprX